MRVLGIDPGLNVTGYGVVALREPQDGARRGHEVTLVEAGVIRPGPPEQPLEVRLAALYDGITEALAAFRPEALALEEVFSHRRFPVSALWMAHARGIACLAAGKAGIPVFSYAPASVKLAIVGQGRATKGQVQHMVALRLGLARPPASPDVADALALALTHLDAARAPQVASAAS
ncbi:MAG: crossover junction endodeoxyribonuclease RuvC [Chloroflexi bacterium]|nr:crossover junction endodeoxyribonuclease RuvC [Chloroflexota bacterium]